MQMVGLLKQRAKDSFVKNRNYTDNIFIEHTSDLEDMWHCITKKIPVLLASGRVKLIVIDSIAALFRYTLISLQLEHSVSNGLGSNTQLCRFGCRFHFAQQNKSMCKLGWLFLLVYTVCSKQENKFQFAVSMTVVM